MIQFKVTIHDKEDLAVLEELMDVLEVFIDENRG